jgi:hypothetical protein
LIDSRRITKTGSGSSTWILWFLFFDASGLESIELGMVFGSIRGYFRDKTGNWDSYFNWWKLD